MTETAKPLDQRKKADLGTGWLKRVVDQANEDLVEIPETSLPAWFRVQRGSL